MENSSKQFELPVELVVSFDTHQQQETNVERAQEQFVDRVIEPEEFKSFKSVTLEQIPNTDLVDSLYDFFIYETFSHFDFGIQGLSVNAATYLAKHLAAFATNNFDNLAEGFVLRVTPDQRRILHYDENIETDKCNSFTPTWNKGIYISNTEDSVNKHDWADAITRFSYQLKTPIETSRIFSNLNVDLTTAFCRHYPVHISQAAKVYLDIAFINTLLDIASYSDTQQALLLRFIEKTHCFFYSLESINKGFKLFLERWKKNNRTEEQLGTLNEEKWVIPAQWGNPIVYMERLLFILEDSRDFEEQLVLLDEIKLHHYHEYYAKKYDDIKVVFSQIGTIPTADLTTYKIDFNQFAKQIEPLIKYRNLAYEASPNHPFNKRNNPLERVSCFVLVSQEDFNAVPDEKVFKKFHLGYFEKPNNYRVYFISDNKIELYLNEYVRPMPANTMFSACCRHLASKQRSIKIPDFLKTIKTIDKDLLEVEKINDLHFTIVLCVLFGLFFIDEASELGEVATEYEFKRLLSTALGMTQRHHDPISIIQSVISKLAESSQRRDITDGLNFIEFMQYTGSIRSYFYPNGEQISNDAMTILLDRNTPKDVLHLLHANPKNGCPYAFAIEMLYDLSSEAKAFLGENALKIATLLSQNVMDRTDYDLQKREQRERYTSKSREYLNQTVENPRLATLVVKITQRMCPLLHTTFTEICEAALELEEDKDIDILLDEHNILPGALSNIPNVFNERRVYLERFVDQLIDLSEPLKAQTIYNKKIKMLRDQWATAQEKCTPHFLNELFIFICDDYLQLPNSWARWIKEKFKPYTIQQLDDSVETIETLAKKIKSLPQNKITSDFLEKALSKPIDITIADNLLRLISKFKDDIKLLEVLFSLEGSAYAQAIAGCCDLSCIKNALIYIKLKQHNPDSTFQQLLNKMQSFPNDPVLSIFENRPDLTERKINIIINLAHLAAHDRFTQFIDSLLQNNQFDAWYSVFNGISGDLKQDVLRILSNVYAVSPPNYIQLTKNLVRLTKNELHDILTCRKRLFLEGLLFALENHPENIKAMLREIEKNPFGNRQQVLEEQFSIVGAERIVNELENMSVGGRFSYAYRKKLLETFLLVNAIGREPSVFSSKAIKDLYDDEIQSHFMQIKTNKVHSIKDRLLAVALMREMMYRATGEFPYISQSIALLDPILHNTKAYAANIDTGQGKTLVDMMKSAWLWLRSERVNYVTSSKGDVETALTRYGYFFKLLNIPFSPKTIQPVMGGAAPEDVLERMGFVINGVNLSTLPLLDLAHGQLEIYYPEINLDAEQSWVINEFDLFLLDTLAINRNATNIKISLYENEYWVYSAINHYVNEQLQHNQAFSTEGLKRFVIDHAQKENLPHRKLMSRIPDDQWRIWLNSSHILHTRLKRNIHYVIVKINESRREAKLLMEDGKISHDSALGQGLHQLLHTQLNEEFGTLDFPISLESTAILSSSLKNALQNPAKYIWCSSGTVGTHIEREKLCKTVGLVYVKIPTHKPSVVKVKNKIVNQTDRLSVTDAKFIETIRIIREEVKHSRQPIVVFCETIDKVNELSQYLKNNTKFNFQCFTATEDEACIVDKAKQPGMITISTPALSRNTDILYDRSVGLTLIIHFQIMTEHNEFTRQMLQMMGRTGRNGSPGTIYFLLGENEIRVENIIKPFQEHQEQLFDIIGYFRRKVMGIRDKGFLAIRTDFLEKKWSEFSNKVEKTYQGSRIELISLHKIVLEFNTMMEKCFGTTVFNETVEALVKEVFAEYQLNKTPALEIKDIVKIEDCIPVPMQSLKILCSDLPPENERTTGPVVIKQEISKIFSNLKQKEFEVIIQEYLTLFKAYPRDRATIINQHRVLFHELLQTKQSSFETCMGWFGFENHLATLTKHENFLKICQFLPVFSSNEAENLQAIRSGVKNLVKNYLNTAWFINNTRKGIASELLQKIDNARTIEALIELLQTEQIRIAASDIERNKSYFFRPLHASGHSRLQETITDALKLCCHLSHQYDHPNFINQLSAHFQTLVNTPQQPNQDISSWTLKDSTNGKVLRTALSNAKELSLFSQKVPKEFDLTHMEGAFPKAAAG